jgi:hypothetical protein
MRILAIAVLALCALPGGSKADRPKVSRAMIKGMEEGLDNRLQRLWSNDPDPVQVIGLTQGVYINGYGAVFMTELNLAPAPGITPFHPKVTADEVKRIHDRKLARISELKNVMTDMLLGTAKSLDAMPPAEQVTLGVSLFYWNWENSTGLPSQIVMHAPRGVLLEGKPAASAKLITEEY